MFQSLFLSAILALAATAAAAEPEPEPEPSGLTAEQRDGLRQGRGMGLSLPAEKNWHPGPLHVLENTEALALTPVQRTDVEGLVVRMKAEAVALGAEVIAREVELDALFAAGHPDQDRLAAVVATIAVLNGRLRLVHLSTHVAATALLTPEQIAAYYRIRHGHG